MPQTIETDPRRRIITPSSWPKKELADYHLEAMLHCQYRCRYCSSNGGMHLKMIGRTLKNLFLEQTGKGFNPHDAGDVVVMYRNLVSSLCAELNRYRRKPGKGKTLVYSQLTDGFSPVLVTAGITRQILDLVLEKTDYRIRILTKNAIVGRDEWVNYFAEHSDRFVVGLSIGTLDDDFSRRMERLTSVPSTRIRALHALQDANVPTYGMLCPVFPHVLDTDELEQLVDRIRPSLCEHVWAEAFNDRENWRHVREAFPEASLMRTWMTEVYEERSISVWSRYAADLYTRIHNKSLDDGWADKLRYLLYEGDITAEDAAAFSGLEGVLLQSPPGDNGFSKNPAIAALERAA